MDGIKPEGNSSISGHSPISGVLLSLSCGNLGFGFALGAVMPLLPTLVALHAVRLSVLLSCCPSSIPMLLASTGMRRALSMTAAKAYYTCMLDRVSRVGEEHRQAGSQEKGLG